MNALDMMKQDINSIIGKTVEYDYGGSTPLVAEVVDVRVKEYEVMLFDKPTKAVVWGISFDGESFYTVDKFVKVLDK